MQFIAHKTVWNSPILKISLPFQAHSNSCYLCTGPCQELSAFKTDGGPRPPEIMSDHQNIHIQWSYGPPKYLALIRIVTCPKDIINRRNSRVHYLKHRTTKKIVGPPDPPSWWSCRPLLKKFVSNPGHYCFFFILSHHMRINSMGLLQDTK